MGKAQKPLNKWFCQCVTICEESVYLVIRAVTERDASEQAHQDYAIAYVEDIFTPLEMMMRKLHLAPTMIGGQTLIPWWTSATKGVNKKPRDTTVQVIEVPSLVSASEQTEHSGLGTMPAMPRFEDLLQLDAPPVRIEWERTRPPMGLRKDRPKQAR